MGGASLKRGPPPVGAVGQFPDPVFAGNPLRNTRRRNRKTRRWAPDILARPRFPDFPNSRWKSQFFAAALNRAIRWQGHSQTRTPALHPVPVPPGTFRLPPAARFWGEVSCAHLPLPPAARFWLHGHLLTPKAAARARSAPRPAAARELVATDPFRLPPAATPFRPLSAPRAPCNAKQSPGGGGRPGGGRPRQFGATAGRSRPRRENW